ncbi:MULTISPECIES: hypothetical protein [unclassified Streptomyces]|uniref:Uncharacterized protein n=1 Tax=Streptomyces sp. NBC_00060 TaxID=2975636 RepID=A0AAU2HFD5_9ACTN
MRDTYRCEVTAYTLDCSRAWGLALDHVITPRLVVRWLCGHAAHLADLMDPHPIIEWCPAEALRPVSPNVPDAPSILRRWCSDTDEHEAAVGLLSDGRIYTLGCHDDTARYALSAVSLAVLRSPRRHHMAPAGRAAHTP